MLSTRPAGEGPVEEDRARAAHVQESRGAGCESRADCGHGGGGYLIPGASRFAARRRFCYSTILVSPRPSWLSLEAATMKLLLDRLTASPTPYRFETAPGWWRAAQPARHGLPAEPSEPFVVELRAHRMGEDLYLEGTHLGGARVRMQSLPRALSSRVPRAVPTRPRARRIARPRRSGGGRGAGAGRHVPGGSVRDGLVPGRGDRSGRVRAGGDLALAPRPAFVSGGLPRAVSRAVGPSSRAGACGCAERKPESPFAVLGTLRLGPSGGRS